MTTPICEWCVSLSTIVCVLGIELMLGNKRFYPQSLYVAFLFLFLDKAFVAQADLKLV